MSRWLVPIEPQVGRDGESSSSREIPGPARDQLLVSRREARRAAWPSFLGLPASPCVARLALTGEFGGRSAYALEEAEERMFNNFALGGP